MRASLRVSVACRRQKFYLDTKGAVVIAEIASAYVSLIPSMRGAKGMITKEVAPEADAAGKTAGSRFSTAMKAGILAGGAAIGAALLSTVKSASEAQQAVGGVEAVFGKYADGVLADSKRAAQGLGLSATAYNELITVSGAMLKNKGIKDFTGESEKLLTVGADLAAMFGGSTTQAVEALNSAMRGESDPIEKYGIALNAAAIEAEAVSIGLVKNVKDLGKIKAAQNTAILAQRKHTAALAEHGKGSDEALATEASLIRSKTALTKALAGEKLQLNDSQKAQAALSLVQKQSADATGAFGRESNTLAGQQARLTAQFENMKVTVGTALLPSLTKLASFVNGTLLPGIKSTAIFVKDNQTAFIALGVTIGTVLAITRVYSAVMAVQAAGGLLAMAKATRVAAAGQWILNAALSANPIGLVIVGLVALGAGLVLAYKKSETFRSVVNKAFSAITAAGTALWEGGLKPAFEGIKKGMDAVGRAGTWLWNNALQPAFSFIVSGVASILDMWSSMLSVLGKVPGFGWAKDAAEAMGNAADKARDLAAGITKIPPAKTVNITVAYKYTGLKSPTRGGGGADELGILPRVNGKGGAQRAFNNVLKEYGAAGKSLMEQVEKGIDSSKPKVISAAQDAFDKLRDKIESKRDALRTTLDGLADEFAGIRDSISGAFAGDLFSISATDAKDAVFETVGGAWSGARQVMTEAAVAGQTVGQNFISNLTAKKAELTGLLASFNTLKGWGVDPAFLTQMFASGNGALITELAGMGQAGAVGAANLFGEVTGLGNQLGTAVANNDPVADEMVIANEHLSQIVAALGYLGSDIGKELNAAAAEAQRKKKGKGKK